VPSILRDSQSDYDHLIQEMPDLYRLGYKASDTTVTNAMIDSALILMLFEVVRDVFLRYQPDVIVLVYPLYQGPLDAVRVLTGKKIPIVTVVTDLVDVHRMWFNDAIDLLLVPTPQVREQAIKYGLNPERVVINGIPTNPDIVKETRDIKTIRAELGWDPELPVVMAVGSKRVRNLPETLRALNHSGLRFQLVAIAGGDDSLLKVYQETEWHHPTHIYNFVMDMPKMLLASDCILSKAGGLIVTESLACGKPLLIIDISPGQEVGNAEYVISNSAGTLAENPTDALETLYHWLDADGALAKQFAFNARAIGHPNSAYDAAKHIWEVAERGVAPKKPLIQINLERSKLVDLLNRNGLNFFAKE
jgi:1,2-diacylglycerol 3-beta-galactosyltransferase